MNENKPLPENIAVSRLMQLCSRSEKSAYEVRRKLIEWGLEPQADRIIKRLTEEKYIDDARFAAAFVHDKIFINKWGKIKVKYMLKRLQISDTDIENALIALDEEAYRIMIFDELRKKQDTLKKYPLARVTSKLFSFGLQRGYETDIIRRFNEKINEHPR